MKGAAAAVVAVVALVAVVVCVLLVGTGLGWWSGAPSSGATGERLAVRTSLDPNPSFFGDELAAEVAVDLDTRTVDPKSVQVDPGFVPFSETVAPVVSRSRAGHEETIVYRYTIQCVSDGCLPGAKPRQIQLPPVVVTAAGGARKARALGRWQPVTVVSRLTPADVSASGNRFRRPGVMPRPVFAVSPRPLATALTVLAALLALGALVLLGFEAARLLERRRARTRREPTPLELALTYVREAATRDERDRRRAAGLLAETLAAEGEPSLAASAGDLAWSEATPSPARALALADEVEAERSPEEAQTA
jgi:hypothetical protein